MAAPEAGFLARQLPYLSSLVGLGLRGCQEVRRKGKGDEGCEEGLGGGELDLYWTANKLHGTCLLCMLYTDIPHLWLFGQGRRGPLQRRTFACLRLLWYHSPAGRVTARC